MRIYFFLALFMTALWDQATAQNVCASYDYQQEVLNANPLLRSKLNDIEAFIKRQSTARSQAADQQRQQHLPLITVPVVVHILYNNQSENISDEYVYKQIELLNQCFRRLNADSVNTPDRFLPFAADCDIEFKLAISDPQRRATTGIIRRYTPVTKWAQDDNIKLTLQAGDDAWDSNSYLNIWVCSLNRILGYASFPGGDATKDGIVIATNAFKNGKTIVHETGHWLGLKHIWGDESCGDDLVDDTPQQSTFTPGCPTGIRRSCSNGADGDMYMNYMDFTSDACTNLFTEGQKMRMRSFFDPGGEREAILSSVGLLPPLISEIPLPESEPKWFYAHLYPNPATAEITIDLSYDIRWIGHLLTVSTVQGQPIMQVKISEKLMKINVASLKPGVYFLTARKEDGSTIRQKLVKM